MSILISSGDRLWVEVGGRLWVEVGGGGSEFGGGSGGGDRDRMNSVGASD